MPHWPILVVIAARMIPWIGLILLFGYIVWRAQ